MAKLCLLDSNHLINIAVEFRIMEYKWVCSKIYIISSVLLIAFSSCRINRNIVYFKDVPDSIYLTGKTVAAAKFSDPRIQPNDIVQVTILTLDPAVNAILNGENTASFSVQPSASNAQSGAGSANGLLVDKDGNIELPIIGKINIKGLTTAVARDSIHNRVALYYINPVVNVKLNNLSVTVLGEVARPATYFVPNEKVSILDAIGMAGDLTLYGKRENILLVRDSVGQKHFVRFNLNSSTIVNSPYFYLQQGDLVYVEPNTAKIQSIDAPRRNTIYALMLSTVAIIITILTRF
jgi:polysaccharide export outer membrane protein